MCLPNCSSSTRPRTSATSSRHTFLRRTFARSCRRSALGSTGEQSALRRRVTSSLAVAVGGGSAFVFLAFCCSVQSHVAPRVLLRPRARRRTVPLALDPPPRSRLLSHASGVSCLRPVAGLRGRPGSSCVALAPFPLSMAPASSAVALRSSPAGRSRRAQLRLRLILFARSSSLTPPPLVYAPVPQGLGPSCPRRPLSTRRTCRTAHCCPCTACP